MLPIIQRFGEDMVRESESTAKSFEKQAERLVQSDDPIRRMQGHICTIVAIEHRIVSLSGQLVFGSPMPLALPPPDEPMPPPSPEAVRKAAILDELVAPGLRAKVSFSGEGTDLRGRIVGYRHTKQFWAPAPYLDQDGHIRVSDIDSPNRKDPTVRGGNQTGHEIGGVRVYFQAKSTQGVAYVIIRANGGYVPARHGGDPLVGSWLAETPQPQFAIVFDADGHRHPSYPGLDYNQHGFVRLRDWRRRAVWWPKKSGLFTAIPKELPPIHQTPLHTYSHIPRPKPPKSRKKAEGIVRVVGIAADIGCKVLGWTTQGAVSLFCMGAGQANLAPNLVLAYQDLSGAQDEEAEYARQKEIRKEKIAVRNQNLARQKEHDEVLRDALVADEASLPQKEG